MCSIKNFNIAFGIANNDNYYIHTLTAVNSVLKNTGYPVTVHIVHDNSLNAQEQDYFKILSNHYNKKIIFYNIENEVLKIPKLHNIERFSKGCLYRLFLPKILPAETVIYLDSDIIAATDIIDFFDKNIDYNVPLMAVLDTAPSHREQFREYIKFIFNDYKGYFNSGVLVFNNYLINKIIENLPGKVIRILKKRPELQFPDQDALNMIFGNSDNISYLSGKINFQLENAKRINYNENMLNGKLIHYSWHKPWQRAFPAGLPYWHNREEVNRIINK